MNGARIKIPVVRSIEDGHWMDVCCKLGSFLAHTSTWECMMTPVILRDEIQPRPAVPWLPSGVRVMRRELVIPVGERSMRSNAKVGGKRIKAGEGMCRAKSAVASVVNPTGSPTWPTKPMLPYPSLAQFTLRTSPAARLNSVLACIFATQILLATDQKVRAVLDPPAMLLRLMLGTGDVLSASSLFRSSRIQVSSMLAPLSL
eukprot:scaffold91616_cov21-Tisochrysis_lutea.AAC.1